MCINTCTRPNRFVHAGLFYSSDQEYLDTLVPFVTEGLALGQPVQVAVPAGNVALLRDALGDAAADVAMIDASSQLRNPSRSLAAMNIFVAANAGRSVRMVGEGLWPGRTREEYSAWVEHETLVTSAFDDTTDGIGLCPYDTRQRLFDNSGIDAAADARLIHPLWWHNRSQKPNRDYAPEEPMARHNRPLAPSPDAVTFVVTAVAELVELRRFVTHYAPRFGLSADRVADLQIIVTELATNSVQHADDACHLALWQRNGCLICEASDSGRLNDPLAGRRPPSPKAIRGRGLWTVNALADVFRVHATAAGTTIQATLRLGTR